MPEKMPVLLVDNSNTRTKFALAAEGCLLRGGEYRFLPTRGIDVGSISSLLEGWKFARVCISSVVPGAQAVFEAAFAGLPLCHVNAAMCGSLFEGYAGADTLGADRVVNVLAAVEHGRFPVVAVDMGTAVTFDVVGGGPRFLGGIIAPGLRMMAEALHAQTSLLPCVDAVSFPPRCIGGNTVEAVQAGVRLAFAGMLCHAMRSLASELGAAPFFIATGGDARLATQWVPGFDLLDESLTLRGIALAAQRAW